MSNHAGSYMLNKVLHLLDESSVFDMLGREKTQELVQAIISMSYGYDCNTGEILDGIEMKVGICYYCESAADELIDGLCPECREEIG